MSNPYASVILPTHSRAETLPIALAAICAQSCSNIEVLVVLDGATPECRTVANAAAALDPRIRVLDLPKAPGPGSENVDRAIAEARAPRIFYSDDDDVWMRDHVMSLGPYLDRYHVVDCPTVSLGLTGWLHVAPMGACTYRMRQLLADFRYKCVFDVHVAHRREICRESGGRRWADSGAPLDRPVWRFLGGLAGDDHVKWASCPAPTSLSVHGACRRGDDPHQRSAELARAALQFAGGDSWPVELRLADYCNHAATLVAADPPGGNGAEDQFEEYYCLRGFDVGTLSAAERDRLYALYETACGRRVSVRRLAAVIDRVSCPVIYSQNFREVYSLVVPPFRPEEAIPLLAAAADLAVVNAAGCWGALGVAFEATGQTAGAAAAFERAIAIGPDPNRALATYRDQLGG